MPACSRTVQSPAAQQAVPSRQACSARCPQARWRPPPGRALAPVEHSRMRGMPSARQMSSIASSSARPCPAAPGVRGVPEQGARSVSRQHHLTNVARCNAASAGGRAVVPAPSHPARAHPCCAAPPAWRKRAPPASWGPCGWWPRKSASDAPAGRVGQVTARGRRLAAAGSREGAGRRRSEAAGGAQQRSEERRQGPARSCPPQKRKHNKKRTARMGTGGLAAPSRPLCLSGSSKW